MAQADFGEGKWIAGIRNRHTQIEIQLPADVWSGSCAREVNMVSAAEIRIDKDYLPFLERQFSPWEDELVFYRDGQEFWVGPLTVIASASDGTDPIWMAVDRMGVVLQRRIWWITLNLESTSIRLFETAMQIAGYSDPIGLRTDPRDNGLVGNLRPIEGDSIGGSIDQLSVILDWTVVGDFIRFGDISVDTHRALTEGSWGTARPLYEQDGMINATHVMAITERGDRAFYPNNDPFNRPADSTLLVDTLEVGDVSVTAALRMAQKSWERRQGGLVLDLDQTIALTPNFPLTADQLIPGAVLATGFVTGSIQAVDQRVRIQSVRFEMDRGDEIIASCTLGTAPVLSKAANTVLVNGIEVPSVLTGLLEEAIPDPIDREAYVTEAELIAPRRLPAPRPIEPIDFEDLFDLDDLLEDLETETETPSTLKRAEAVFSQFGAVVISLSGRYGIDFDGRIVGARISLDVEGTTVPHIHILNNSVEIAIIELPLVTLAGDTPSLFYELDLGVVIGDSLQIESTVDVSDAESLTVQIFLEEDAPVVPEDELPLP